MGVVLAQARPNYLYFFLFYTPENEIPVSVVYKDAFDEIQCEFAQLFYSITMIMKEANVSLEDLKEFLAFNHELEPLLQDADTIPKVMRAVQQKSSFINCTILKSVVMHPSFNITAAIEKIDAYYKIVEDFCQHKLTQHSYVTSFLADQSRKEDLLSYETITFKLEWNPEKKTLANIQTILSKTFKSLTGSIQVVVVGGGCVTVTCYAPLYLMGALVRLAQKSKEMLVESGVTYLNVGNTVLLDNRAHEKVKIFTPCARMRS